MKEELESAIALEAALYCEAALSLNPYGEAEVLEIGSARAVYSGAVSSVHGVFGLALDGPVEERDFQEIEKFYERKERAPSFWVADFADSSIYEFLGKYKVTKTQKISALKTNELKIQNPVGNNAPDLNEWSDRFSKVENALASLTRVHQKNIRFYLNETQASFTFFSNGIALIPFLQESLFSKQAFDAQEFQAKIIAHLGEGKLPALYERKLYERI